MPVDIQYSIFLKILSFDRNLTKNADNNEIVIGIIYQSLFRGSLNVKNQFEKAFEKSDVKNISGLPIRIKPIDIQNTSLEDTVSIEKINIFYITPLRAVDISTITSYSKANKIMSLTGVPEYCTDGVAVGIGLKSGSPQILINLEASKQESVNFSSQLLRFARIIK